MKQDYAKQLKRDKTGWFIGLLVIISFIVLLSLIISVDWEACTNSVKGFCE